jgi:hypothetical protein
VGWQVTRTPLSSEPRDRGRKLRLEILIWVAFGIGALSVGVLGVRSGSSGQELDNNIIISQGQILSAEKSNSASLSTLMGMLVAKDSPAAPVLKSTQSLKISPTPVPRTSKEGPKVPSPNQGPPPTKESLLPPSSEVLSISQVSKVSTRANAPFEIEVVVQKKVAMPTLKMAIECDKPLIDARLLFGGVRMMTQEGIVKDHPNIFIFSYESATPMFDQSHAVVVDFWAKEFPTCGKVATF